MELSVMVLLAFNFLFIGTSPSFFFRKDGTYNFKWIMTALPLLLWPAPIFGVHFGYLQSVVDLQGNLYPFLLAIGVLLSLTSVVIMSMALASHRIPLALWHQENDAPRSIVTWGAYKHIRHPFYTSFILAQLAMLFVTCTPLQVLFVAYQFVALNLTAAREESRLSASQFGEEYKAYIKNTGRFFPSI